MTQQTVRSRTRADQEVAISRGHLNRETHVRHRDYSPTLGRFIERDPIGFEAGDGNWYRFVANGPTGKTDATGLLAPNIGKGRGDYHYTWHEVHFRAGSAAGCDRLRNKIYDDLKSFRFFNGGSNWEATVRIDGNIAYFDAQGLYGSGSDRIGNADEAPVSLAFFDARFLVVATTLEGHLLDGKRHWTVFVDKGPFCQCDVTIATWAYERKVGIVNDIGVAVASVFWNSQLKVWDGYLMNIADNYSTPGGCSRSPITGRPFVYHVERMTGLRSIPEFL